MTGKRTVAIVAVALSAGCFALYAALAARDVMFGDGVELVLTAARNGVAHPPGFPLWIVLAHLATLVPFGALAYRVNVTASLYHALAVGLTYCSGYVLTRRHGAALFAAAALAVGSPLFVSWSLQAEVFSLNDLFAAAIVFLTLAWLDDGRRTRLALGLALLFGLGLSNHQTLLLIAPLPLWAAWCARSEIRGSRNLAFALAGCAALFAAGFALPYTHTLLASQHAARWQLGQARSIPELLDVIDRRVYGSFNLVLQPNERGGTFAERTWWTLVCGGWPYAAIALGIGALAWAKRYRAVVAAALAVAGPLVVFCAVANFNLDTTIARGIFARFGLLPLVALAPFAAAAVLPLDALVRDARARAFAGAAVFALAAAASLLRLPELSLAAAHGPRTLAKDVFAALPPDAILLTASAAAEIVPAYYQEIEGWRPDVTEIGYGYLSSADYRAWRSRAVDVPADAGLPLAPNDTRDILVRANAARPFFVVGDRPIHAPGPLSQPLVEGVVSRMIPMAARVNVRAHYAREAALQSVDGYGDIDDDFWRSNGFADEVRAFYAGGFFVAGVDARRLGKPMEARAWLERASAYSADPLIDAELRALGST